MFFHESAMYVPSNRERVQIAGRSGIFLVVWIDQEHQAVDVIPLHGAIHAEENVPFADLEAFRENRPSNKPDFA